MKIFLFKADGKRKLSLRGLLPEVIYALSLRAAPFVTVSVPFCHCEEERRSNPSGWIASDKTLAMTCEYVIASTFVLLSVNSSKQS